MDQLKDTVLFGDSIQKKTVFASHPRQNVKVWEGGVGRINAPRFSCIKGSNTGEVDKTIIAARILQKYLKDTYNGAGGLILVAKKETLTSDHV